MILSGALSESDDRAGVERFYLSGLDTPQLYGQTSLCLIVTTGAPTCPDRTERCSYRPA